MTGAKAPGTRARRNAGQKQWSSLPAEGRHGRAPALGRRAGGGSWLASTQDWWRVTWASPMATAYLDADLDALRRLATLRDMFSRGETGARDLAAIQQLEDRFGMSPGARQRLMWMVTQGKAAESAPERPPREVGNVRRLRAIDPRGEVEEAG